MGAIWDDIDAWWTSSAVQKNLQKFMRQYCHTDGMLNRLEPALRLAVAEAKNLSPAAIELEKISADML